jgi:ribosome-associated translation inhibitor RaiA
MEIDLQTRGFTLTPALRGAVASEAQHYLARFPRLAARLHVRLFDVNGRRGGIDKGCLVEARIGRRGKVVFASDLDANLYRAVASAFEKLERSTESALARANTVPSGREPRASQE